MHNTSVRLLPLNPQTSASLKKAGKVEMKAITIKNIDPETFRKFKVACAEDSIDMRQAILDFMQHYPVFNRIKNPKK